MTVSVIMKHIMNTRLNYHKLFFSVFIFLLLISPLHAEITYDSGEKNFDFDNIKVPDYFLRNNSLYYYYENVSPERSIIVHNYFASRFGGLDWEAPLLIYRCNSFDIAPGFQVSRGLMPFVDSIPFGGVRAATYFKGGGILGYWGESSKVTDWTFASDLESYKLWGLSLRKQLGMFTSAQAGVHNFHISSNTTSQQKKSYIQTLSIASSPVAGFNARLSLGRDDKNDSLWNNDYTADDWSLSYRIGNFSLNSYGKRTGKHFGPESSFNFKRGQMDSNSTIFYRLNENLYANLSYFNFNYENPQLPDRRNNSKTIVSTLNWRINPDITTSTGFRRQNSVFQDFGGISSSNRYNQYYANIRWQRNRLSLTGDLKFYNNFSRLNGEGSYTNAQGLHANYDLTSNQRIGVFIDNDQTFLNGDNNSNRKINLGFRYSCVFPRDQGSFEVNYSQNEFYDQVLGIPIQSRSQSARLDYWLTKVFNFSGSYNRSIFPGQKSAIDSFRATLRYILTPHSDIMFSYFTNPFVTQFYIQGKPYELKNILSLQFRQSFGGSLERDFSKRVAGAVRAKVRYYPKGSPDDIRELAPDMPDVYFKLDLNKLGVIEADTNGNSAAYFARIMPGNYELVLDKNKLDNNLKVIDSYQRFLSIAPGQEKREDFLLEASSSVYIVVWNDYLGTGVLDPIYTGFEGIEVTLDGQKKDLTNQGGVVVFQNLTPGKHVVSIDPSILPPGLSPTTPDKLELELMPGKETVVSFGLQGWGNISGRVYAISTGTKDVKRPAPGVPVFTNEIQVAISDENGYYSARVPAGNHVLTVKRSAVSGYSYFVSEENVAIKVNPVDNVSTDFIISNYGTIRGQLVEVSNGSRIPVKHIGAVIYFSGDPDFIYTNDKGSFEFRELTIGEYSLEIDKDYLPAGYRLVSPEKLRIPITAGEVKEVFVELMKLK
jgi:hypothetical protein